MADKITVTVREACNMTGLSRTTIYDLFKSGDLPKRKIGGRTLIRVSDIQSLVDGATAEAA